MTYPDDITVHCQWQTDNADIAKKAIHFWQDLGVLPEDVTPEERAKELVYCALDRDGRIIAVTTAVKAICPFIKLPMFFLRFLVHPDYRLSGIGSQLFVDSAEMFMAKAENGSYQGAKGIASRAVNPALVNHYDKAILTRSQLTYIGTMENGNRIRIRYFDGATLP